MMDTITNPWVLLPAYNDWKSLQRLLPELISAGNDLQMPRLSILVVDDGSHIPPDPADFPGISFYCLRLRKNMGHQRAIAIGLAWLAENMNPDLLWVMDADGEDDPQGMIKLINARDGNQNHILFASRSKRAEARSFRLGYQMYKWMFRLLTGEKISFGNFSLIPGKLLPAVVNISEIWSHYSGGIMKARIPYLTVPVDRKKRYSGNSSMNYTSLIVHGLRSISVYLDKLAARMMLFFMGVALATLIGVAVVLYFKFFTNLAIPGWTTAALSGLLILLFQSILTTLMLAFIVLGQSSQRLVIPAVHYRDYVNSVYLVSYEDNK